jgi:Type II restriction endonuclease EcoO109I
LRFALSESELNSPGRKPLLEQERIEEIVQNALDQFYNRRLASFEKLSIKGVLKRKNPYMFRAIGINTPRRLVEAILSAYLSSSDEGIFGNVFFEPVAKNVSGGRKSITDSVDIELEVGNLTRAYAVKSGLAVFNKNSLSRQIAAFEECRRRLTGRAFEAVVGYGYGRKVITPTKGKKNFREVSGQAFWEEISGDPELYKKLLDLVGKKADEHAATYEKAFAEATDRLVRQFESEFATADGKIDWHKVLEFNSGKQPPKLSKKAKGKKPEVVEVEE